MGEFYMENWDLQAVVGGSGINFDAGVSYMETPEFIFDPWSIQQEDLLSFPESFETNPKVLDELQELYKPFYPELTPLSTQTIITSSLPVPQDSDEPADQNEIGQHSDEPADQNEKGQQSVSRSAASRSITNKDSSHQSANKPKRSRKNQQNRVVQHVTADVLSSDKWAWRKYGQKPIKGSPYPRSYYRCSSSKGCLARKQVERSCSDPGTFIITYTAEHSHGHPTRRNSLAGSTRNKSPSSTTPRSLGNKTKLRVAAETAVSPTTIKDECVQQDYQSIKLEEQILQDIGEGDKLLTPDITLSDELLVQSMENFEGLFLDQFSDLSNELWSMNELATLTGSC